MRGDERGQIGIMVLLAFAGLLAMVGVALDGGMVLAAKERAIDEAGQAARAAAESVDSAALRSGGRPVLDPDAASAAAQTYLAHTGDPGQARIDGSTVTVTVQITQPLRILGIFGARPVQVHGVGTARAVPGIETGSP